MQTIIYLPVLPSVYCKPVMTTLYSTLYCGWNQSTTIDENSKELQCIPQSSSKSPFAWLFELILAITYVNFKTVMTASVTADRGRECLFSQGTKVNAYIVLI